MRRFEISAAAFLAFNALFAYLSLREQRSLLIACEDWRRTAPGDPDCLEPYNYLGLELVVAAWIVGGLVLLVVCAVLYRHDKRILGDGRSIDRSAST